MAVAVRGKVDGAGPTAKMAVDAHLAATMAVDQHLGAARTRRPIPGSRNSEFKRLISGKIVRRNKY